jgi:hypothetical protein
MQGVNMSRIEYRSDLEGFVEYRNVNGINYTMAHRLYCDGELITKEIYPEILDDNTYLISAIGINGNVTQLTIYELTIKHGIIQLEEFNLREKEITDDLLRAIGDVHTLCSAGNNGINGIVFDTVND